ncbi:hypothetical protein ACE3MQ_21655 [Paenibacillus lentus]|uniref:hypothetical protein n=1 Tax=Paenibacillus lentus TaxID=1338368 RepID=UPI003662324F
MTFRTNRRGSAASGAPLYDFSYKVLPAAEKVGIRLFSFYTARSSQRTVFRCMTAVGRPHAPPYNHQLNSVDNDGNGHKANTSIRLVQLI